MSERKIIDEIKQLLFYSINEKARPDGSESALPSLEEAVKLSNKIKNPIWSNVPKYRLAHLLFRSARTVDQLKEISNLLSDVINNQANRKLNFLCHILLIAASCRLKEYGEQASNLDLNQLTRAATASLRILQSESSERDNSTSNLQSELFNLLELSTYFSGEDYSNLLGLSLSEKYKDLYIELVPSNASPEMLWRIVLTSGKLDEFAYSKEEAKQELDGLIEYTNADFYYIFENGQPTFYKRNNEEVKFKKYINSGNRSTAAFLTRLHMRYPLHIGRDELLSVTPKTKSLDKFNAVKQIRTHIRKEIGVPDIIQVDERRGDKLGTGAKLIGIIPQSCIRDFC